MCGIIGFISKKKFNSFKGMLPQAALNLHHRGPDDEGSFYDEEIGIGLAHRRLSIIDLSRAGHQPMTNDDVYIVYRRSEAELPARREEVENAQEEGVIFKLLTNPKRFIGDDEGHVVAMECYHMELGEPDESGRRRPVVKEGSEFVIDVDIVVIALGTTPNPLLISATEGLETTKRGTVVADEESGKTVKPCVWAGGDLVTGAATVISAMGAGKRAAASIDTYLKD